MPDSVIPLITFLVEVPDFRSARGRRYSLAAILALASDGNTLRGSQKGGAPGSPLLAAVSQQLGFPFGQCAVADKSTELSAPPSC